MPRATALKTWIWSWGMKNVVYHQTRVIDDYEGWNRHTLYSVESLYEVYESELLKRINGSFVIVFRQRSFYREFNGSREPKKIERIIMYIKYFLSSVHFPLWYLYLLYYKSHSKKDILACLWIPCVTQIKTKRKTMICFDWATLPQSLMWL